VGVNETDIGTLLKSGASAAPDTSFSDFNSFLKNIVELAKMKNQLSGAAAPPEERATLNVVNVAAPQPRAIAPAANSPPNTPKINEARLNEMIAAVLDDVEGITKLPMFSNISLKDAVQKARENPDMLRERVQRLIYAVLD
jgi:hypothetical protein